MVLPLIRILTYSHVQHTKFIRMPCVLRWFSINSKETINDSRAREERQEKAKVRRAYAIGGCVFFMWISTHGMLLYRRRREFRSLNKQLPAIPWNQFVEEYLAIGKVKTIIYQPHFETGNVYLHSSTNTLLKHPLVDFPIASPDKYIRRPDIRFLFDGSEDVKQAVTSVQKSIVAEGRPVAEIEFELDKFPNYMELSIIVGTTFATLLTLIFAS